MSAQMSLLKNLSGFASSKASKLFQKLGAADPFMTIAVLCMFNMTVRPLITLSDKNQPKDRKIYAALREGITELIAFPTCFFFSRYLGGKLGTHFALNKSKEGIQAVQNVFSLGGLVVANFVIPILSTLALDPIMKDVKKRIIKDKANLNVVSESKPIMTNNIPKTVIPKPLKTNNIWSHYNFTTSPGLTIGK